MTPLTNKDNPDVVKKKIISLIVFDEKLKINSLLNTQFPKTGNFVFHQLLLARYF